MAEIKNNKQALVSVVVPVYNAEPYLEACIRSLLAQTYQNLEIILVDDGSTDCGYSICKRFEKDSEGKVRVVHKENGGVSSARNLGITLAEGEYLIFVDADDLVHRELLEIYMEANDRGKVLICQISSDKNDLDKKYGDKWKDGICNYSKENFMELFIQNYMNSPCNKLYNIEVLRKNNIRFRENLNLGEDLIFNLEYFRCSSSEYALIMYPLYCYQGDHRGSLTNDFRPDLFDVQLELFQILKEFLYSERLWNIKNQKLYYGVLWDRLYLTVRIYLEHRDHCDETDGTTMLQDILSRSEWREIEQECKARKLMTLKRIIKKWHLVFWRSNVNRSRLCI